MAGVDQSPAVAALARARGAQGGEASFGAIHSMQIEISDGGVHRLMLPARFQLANAAAAFSFEGPTFSSSNGLTGRMADMAQLNARTAQMRDWLVFLLTVPANSGIDVKTGPDATIDGQAVATVVGSAGPTATIEIWFAKSSGRTVGYRTTRATVTATGEVGGIDATDVRIRTFQRIGGAEFPQNADTNSARTGPGTFTAKVTINPAPSVDKFFEK